jgi:hypothetical protein
MSGRRFASLARLVGLTSAPSSPGAGDMWYRSDLAQFRGSDGGAGEQLTLGPEGNLPVIASTRWHSLPGYGNAAALNIPDGRLFALPFWPGRACTLTGSALNVTTLLAGTSARMGVYLSDGVYPTTLLSDFGTVTTASTGIRSITGLNVAIRPVLHYLVIARQGAAGTLAVSSRSTWEPIVSDSTPTIAANTNTYYIDSVTGALPGSFGAPAGTDQGPCLTVQLT